MATGSVALLAAALLAGTLAAPAGATSQPSTIERPPIREIVTLGDSYSSGAGIHRHAKQYDHGPDDHAFDPSTRLGSSACYRHLSRTPGAKLAAEMGVPSTMVACAGAVVDDIENQLDAARIEGAGHGALILLTIGGNDVRSHRGEDWTDVLSRCITTFGCDRDINTIADLDALEDDLVDAYTLIGKRHPAARVRVLAYPRLMQPGRWTCVGVAGIGRAEGGWIDRQVDTLNGAIQRAVHRAAVDVRADLKFVPVRAEFNDRGACRVLASDRYVNTTVFGQTYNRRMVAGTGVTHHYRNDLINFSSASFHPSQKGYDAYLRALRSSL